jgi:hypothetical protein
MVQFPTHGLNNPAILSIDHGTPYSVFTPEIVMCSDLLFNLRLYVLDGLKPHSACTGSRGSVLRSIKVQTEAHSYILCTRDGGERCFKAAVGRPIQVPR